MKSFHYAIIILSLLLISCSSVSNKTAQDRIQPYSEDTRYWQYKGEPVLLLGGTKNDNLFQIPDLEEHLNELHGIGGNYIRNTMSTRDSGDAFPFLRTPEGKYNLDKWNEKYWEKFENLLKLTSEREIIIQIEVWDKYDYSTKYWTLNPWNPVNNINYTEDESGLAVEYPESAYYDLQPFFHTINTLPRYEKRLEVIKKYQNKLIDKMLSYSLKFGNVLYCMNNETTTPIEWGKYWIGYIKDKAQKKGVQVYLTDMFDRFFKPQECEECQKEIEQPGIYTFMDISQINRSNFDEKHWEVLQWIMNKMKDYVRPVNNTKIYGGGNYHWGSGTNKDGVERFCRNIIGGCASARSHRPPWGNSLNQNSIGIIKSFRKLETQIKMWDVEVHMELLSERSSDEAYLRAEPGEKYAVYFTDGGSVGLDLTEESGKVFKVKWINIGSGEWGSEDSINGGDVVNISAPADGGWFAAIVRE